MNNKKRLKFFHFLLQAVFLFSLVFSTNVYSASLSSSKVSLNFVETDIRDVVHTLSKAYGIPIIVEQSVKVQVTVHLENIEVWDALQAICGTNGLSFKRENGVFCIRKAKFEDETFFAERNGKIDLNVNGQGLKEFLQEFSKNTGLSIVFPSDISGSVYANLQGVLPLNALKGVLAANKFSLKKKDSLYLVVPLGNFIDNENLKIEKNNEFYTLKSYGASLLEIVQTLALEAKKNVVFYADANENIVLDLDSVSLENALEILFNGSRYAYGIDSSGTIIVGEKGKQEILREVELFPLKYLSSTSAIDLLEKTFGEKNGKSFEVKEQNGVLLVGTSSEILAQKKFLEKIDLPVPQVLLECLIVEFRKGKNFELGLRGGTSRKTVEGNVGFRGHFSFPGKDIGLFNGYGQIGILPDKFVLELASLEEKDLAEVLARPSISTRNGTKAGIFVTNTSYYQVNQVSADGFPIVDYRSFNDGISLEITPTVTRSGEITITVSPEIKTSSRSTGDGPRDISTRNLQTTVSLKNGETLCLGGLLRKNQSEVLTALPFLGSLPLIGRFFQYSAKEEETSELAVFITPKVLERKQNEN